MEQLGDLEAILSSVNFNLINSCICIGDLNVDLKNTRSTRFIKALQTFMIMECVSVK